MLYLKGNRVRSADDLEVRRLRHCGRDVPLGFQGSHLSAASRLSLPQHLKGPLLAHMYNRHMHCKLRKFILFFLLHSHVSSVSICRRSIGSTSSHEKRSVRICYEPCCFYWLVLIGGTCWKQPSWYPSRSPLLIHPLKNKQTKKTSENLWPKYASRGWWLFHFAGNLV